MASAAPRASSRTGTAGHVHRGKDGRIIFVRHAVQMPAAESAELCAIARRRGLAVSAILLEAWRDWLLRGPVYSPPTIGESHD